VRLVVRALRNRPSRASIAIGGVATSSLLVIALMATLRGAATSVVAYVGQDGADLWITPPGADHFLRLSGVLPAALTDSVRALPGVAAADFILRAFVAVSSRRRGASFRLTLYGVGYRAPDGLGGPPRFRAGRPPETRREVALDRAAARRLGVGLDDTVFVNGRAARVVGVTMGTNLLVTQFIFADAAAIEAMSGFAGRASFIIVRLAPGAHADTVAARIRERFPDVDVFNRATFVANSQRETGVGYTPILSFVDILGIGAAAVLIGLLIHALVEGRRTELAALLALGAASGLLARVLIREAARLIVVGGLLGAVLARLLALVLDRVFPLIPLRFNIGDTLWAFALLIACGMVASAVPVARLGRVDPLEAFRS
jgi:putative ABC transport system permease protein